MSYSVSKDGSVLLRDTLSLELTEDIAYLSVPLALDVTGGLYEVRVELSVEGESVRLYKNGFWGHDQSLLESVKTPSCDKDYFYIDGKVQPIAGMTYMQPDLHRKYLFLPNPVLWDIDFAEFKRAGINMVRTGIWTAYRHISFIDGYTDEVVLRAFEAMVHTASRYGIPLVFNFFAFAPERWEGVNPYLDPRSTSAQKRFISSFVSRVKSAGVVMWDLINEPSVLNHNRLWQTRPNGDRYELEAWHEWLRKKHGTVEVLRERWGLTSDALSSIDSAPFPSEDAFNDNPCYAQYKNSLSVADYYLFAQDMFTRWAREMTQAIKAAGSGALVTVGQDESIQPRRPNPLLHKDAVDYVCVHSWWLMDSLYYDGVTAKPLDKPCLVQETGIMYVSNPDTRIRRNLNELRDILERKYALALGSGCAGAVHWLWNTNCQMDDVNEAHIGALFADGAHKPEADVSYDFGSFSAKTAGLYKNRKKEDIAVVFPFSSLFSSRDSAVPAINNLCRIMGYELNTHFDLVSEYEADKCAGYKLIILPSPGILTQHAWDSLMGAVSQGSTLVITGPVWDDEYFVSSPGRAALLGVDGSVRNAAREEQVVLDGTRFNCSYGGDGLAWIDRGDTPDGSGITSVSHGKGRITWCALPVEVCGNASLIKHLYGREMERAGIMSDFTWIGEKAPGVFLRRLDFDGASLYIAVSESGGADSIKVRDNKSDRTLSFTLESQRTAMFMVSTDGGLIASYRDVPVEIKLG
ncbi:MAG: cellulase family glycosylhydrolase [Eubacteriales bacterium]